MSFWCDGPLINTLGLAMNATRIQCSWLPKVILRLAFESKLISSSFFVSSAECYLIMENRLSWLVFTDILYKQEGREQITSHFSVYHYATTNRTIWWKLLLYVTKKITTQYGAEFQDERHFSDCSLRCGVIMTMIKMVCICKCSQWNCQLHYHQLIMTVLLLFCARNKSLDLSESGSNSKAIVHLISPLYRAKYKLHRHTYTNSKTMLPEISSLYCTKNPAYIYTRTT